MSVVVAIKENGKVTIGADSQCTRGGTRRTLSNPNNYKVWKVLDAENCLFAQVGLVREANIIRVARDLVPEMAQLKDKVDFSFVVKRLVPRMFEELEEYRAIKKATTHRSLIRRSSLRIRTSSSTYQATPPSSRSTITLQSARASARQSEAFSLPRVSLAKTVSKKRLKPLPPAIFTSIIPSL